VWTWRRVVIGVLLVVAIGGWVAFEMSGGPIAPAVFSGP